jgi:hypothetical protein
VPVVMRGPDGQNINADEGRVQFWINQGFRPISDEEIGQEIQARAAKPEDRGVIGDINAGVTSALSGMTLGATDVALAGLLNRGQRQRLVGDIQNAPNVAGAARFAGELLPAIVSDGALSATPAGALGRFATEVGEHIGGTGAAARVARMVASGAVEGGIGNAGQYLGQMALADKDLSAEGFLASMGSGALYGGGAAGALGIAGEGLTAARRLLPETELTPLAVRRATEAAKQEVSAAVDESRVLQDAGRQRARQLREEWVAGDSARRAELDGIALTKARELADAQVAAARAKASRFEADAAAAQSRAEAAASRAERAKKPRGSAAEGEAANDIDAEVRRAIKAGEVPGEVGPFNQKGLDLAVEREKARRALGGSSAPELVSDLTNASADDLLRQLHGTKQALDEGQSLADLSARAKDHAVEDALNRRVAQESPDMDRLLKHLDGLADARDQVAAWLDKHPKGKVRSFEFQEGMRKPTGWVDKVPEGEGSLLVPRGRQGEFRGTEAERQSFERGVERRDLRRRIDDPLVSDAEKLQAQQRLAEMDVQSAARKRGEPVPERTLDASATAQEVIHASEHAPEAPSVDKHVEDALNGHADLHEDVHDATDAIGALEQKTADLADELGPEAPPLSADRARTYRETQQQAEAGQAQAADGAIADADRAAKMISTGDAPKKATGLLSRASDAGQLLEALKLMGVPVPDASSIPVVGPLLSLYLKAKLANRALKGLGGKVPRTAETEIARRAAGTKEKLMRATDHALGLGGHALTSPGAARVGGAAAVLSSKLFDDGETKQKKPAEKDLAAVYLARKDELDRAQQPGAVMEAMRRQVRTGDMPLLQSIAAAEERKLKFLHDKMPKVDDSPQILGGKSQRVPARADLEQWSKYVAAAQHPAETLGMLLSGELASSEAAETIRVVAPRLLQDVQQRIVEKATSGKVEVSHRKRVHLSLMLGIPLDDSQSPESAQFLDMLYQQKAQSQAASVPAPSPVIGNASERVNPETRI